MKVVCNSTVLVHLSAMGRLDLLRDIFGEIYIPNEVYEEVVTRGANRAGMMEVSNASWINVQRITNHLAFEVLSTTLGAGESACIVLAFEIGADLVILDDRQARLRAQMQGLNVTGTVGVLMVAAEQGKTEFEQALDSLLATGFRLSPAEFQRVMSLWRSERQGKMQSSSDKEQ